jgi:hypothetical protein
LLKEFAIMNERGAGKEEIERYLQTHIPNLQEVVSTAFQDFKRLYVPS